MSPTVRRDGVDDPAEPPPASLFAPVDDHYGRRLALVFGNQAPGGLCPWLAKERCWHCDIGAGEGRQLSTADNLARLASFRRRYASLWPQLAHLCIYNSGSVLNRRELGPPALAAIVEFARTLPMLRALSLDSREPFISRPLLTSLATQLGAQAQLRPILGIESADETVRNRLLDKAMPAHLIVRAFDEVAAANRQLGGQRCGLDVNIVVGGPGRRAADAVADAVATASWALKLGGERQLSVDLNLHAYYPSRRGVQRFPDHPRCPPSLLARAVLAIAALRDEVEATAGIFIGWQDEGHDTEPTTRSVELDQAGALFAEYNRRQSAQLVAPLVAG